MHELVTQFRPRIQDVWGITTNHGAPEFILTGDQLSHGFTLIAVVRVFLTKLVRHWKVLLGRGIERQPGLRHPRLRTAFSGSTHPSCGRVRSCRPQ
ncbi:hypothetical protein AVT69_gp124 [Pseudomonas phage PhiPA3]|uniref:Uncharacterized protein 125 n=1 Tax=Pseudomonas phage PhiPA3 TaxID=998086 RepID=F8SJZ9_BPPA3|nr:hypothetical protein AVT69_gp124 [Pseudomonas phage PhiPA3]AEH03549.1 hypothetical protein [Pseudomonas phage PhiPA3]